MSKLDLSEFQLSEFEQSEFELSEFQLSEFELSEFELSEFELSEFKLSEFELSEFEQSCTPKVNSGPTKLYSKLDKTPDYCLHNDHNYLKNSRSLNFFYFITIIYKETMNKSKIAKINCVSNNLITGQGI